MRTRRRYLLVALGLSLSLHLLAFFYPTLLAQGEELSRPDQADVVARHAGGHLSHVHLHLDTDDSLPAAGHTLHIHWLPPTTVAAASSMTRHTQPPRAHHRHRPHPPKKLLAQHPTPATPPVAPAAANATPTPAAPPALPAPPAPPAAIAMSTANDSHVVMSAAATPLLPNPPPAPTLATTPPTPDNSSGQTSPAEPSEDVAHSDQSTPTLLPPASVDTSSFPHDVRALYHLRVGLSIPIGADALEHWQIQGSTYHLQLDARKFGFKARILSIGGVSAQGLAPQHFELQLNGRSHTVADFSYATHSLSQGAPLHLKTSSFPDGTQDMFSFAYHLALTFADHPDVEMTVTNGSTLYLLHFTVVDEETLTLPAGTLRTIHLRGSRQAHGSTQTQAGFDAWLAPDFCNIPVRMSGPDSSGHIFVMTLKSLEFDGQPLFGQNLPRDMSSDGHLPAQLAPLPEVQPLLQAPR